MFKLFTLTFLTFFASSTVHADARVLGLICDQNLGAQDTKTQVDIEVNGKSAVIQLVDAYKKLPFLLLEVPVSQVTAILNKELSKMNGVSIQDKRAKVQMTFKVDGYTYDQKPRLGIKVKSGREEISLKSCDLNIEKRYKPF